jgi:AcrR family transcriptional regulator
MQKSDATTRTVVRDAEVTRASILDAAETEFAKVGLLGARTESIAARTGVTKAMIHYYFENKENLYRAVIERAVQRRSQEFGKIPFEQMTAVEGLKAIVDSLMAEMKSNPCIASILLFEALQNEGAYCQESSVGCFYEPIITLLERGMNEGVFRQLDARHVAVNLVGMSVFYVCTRSNLQTIWPVGTDLMADEQYGRHQETTINMLLSALCINN